MKKHLALAILCGCLSQPSFAAEGIDAVFPKEPPQRTWNDWLTTFFDGSGFNKSYAVVIGVSEFEAFDDLGNPDDAIRLKNYLVDEAKFDYVHLLTEDKVTPERVRQIMMDEVPSKIGNKDRFLFYWVGHGTTWQRGGDKLGYLPVAKSTKAYSSMVDMEELAKWDRLLEAKQTLYLLDACFSGLTTLKTQGDSAQARTLKQIAHPSRQILTAGSANEETIVIGEHSIFNTALLDGLRGKADLPINGVKDGIISATELLMHVKDQVEKNKTDMGWTKPITPTLKLLPFSGEGDFFLFSPNTLSAVQEESSVVDKTPKNDVTQIMSDAKPDRLPFEPEMIAIPAGSFTMGCLPERDLIEGLDKCPENELPAHEVNVAAFEMGKYEVTFDEWDACEQAKVCPPAKDEGWGRGRRPVIDVSWNDAQVYLKWLNQQTGKNYRLPTEAEWEYAARGGKGGAYPWGRNQIRCEDARYGGSLYDCKQSDKTLTVGSYDPNGFGLYDTVGNVVEWTQSNYTESYDAAVQQDRVLRGDSWFDRPENVRSAHRGYSAPTSRNFNIGFRISRTF